MAGGAQRFSNLRRFPGAEQCPMIEHRRAGAERERLLQPVLAEQHRRPQLAIDLSQNGQKFRRRDRVELARRLVEDQKIRLHDHHGRQIQHLLLPAGEGRDVPVKPVFNAEERGHLGHAPPDDRRLIAEAFQPEGQLVPDLVGHELVVDILLHKADFPAAVRLRKASQRLTVQQDLTHFFAVRREGGLQLPQQRALSAAGRPAEHKKFAALHRQRDAAQRRLVLSGVGKAEIVDFQEFHFLASQASMAHGVSASASSAAAQSAVRPVKPPRTVG